MQQAVEPSISHSLEIQRVRGTNDFPPPAAASLRSIEGRLHSAFELHCYERVETPVLESTELFLRKSGEEIVSRMYSFTHWNRKLCLRPEFTASVIRAYVNEMQDRPLPLRLYYSGPTFRYEKPQRGRYRQFTEVGVECIGGAGAAADAEILHLACTALGHVGVTSFSVVVGHVGVVYQALIQLGIGERGRALILGSMEDLSKGRLEPEKAVERIAGLLVGRRASSGSTGAGQLPALEVGRMAGELLDRTSPSLDGSRRGAQEIVARLLEKARRPDPRPAVHRAVSFILRLRELAGSPESSLDALRGLLQENGLESGPLQEIESALVLMRRLGPVPGALQVDLSLARGLQYYTGMVFEIYADVAGGPLQVCGGGRYDELVRALGGRGAVPACGFSFGLERVKLAAEASGVGAAPAPAADLLLVPLEAEDLGTAMELASALRRTGVRTDLDIRLKGPKSNLRRAEREGVPLVAFLGARERETGMLTLRRMAARTEENVPFQRLQGVVVEYLGHG